MLKRPVPITLCAAFALGGHAQASLRGSVTELGTGIAVPYVSIYLPEIHSGTLSDSTGSYTLSVPDRGTFLVQFTQVGYESQFREITVGMGTVQLDVALRFSQLELREVDVVGTQLNAPRETSRKVEMMSAREMRESGALSVSDAVAHIPGVTQLTTGVGISKPVIRGLYGNRVQVIIQGSRFDNQQWQDEHGMGLSIDGVERVEVIKGAAALQYGSDAIGGVVNVIDDKPAPIDSMRQDARLQFFSNTRGVSAGYGIRKSNAKSWWRVHAGADSHADFSSAGDARVINSRFASYAGKAAMGWQRKRWVSVNNLFASLSQFGFIFDSLASDVDDGRTSRSFQGPHHTVLLGMFSSENTFYGDKVKWNVNAGWISNKRQEQEGGNKISLDMLLNSATLTVQGTSHLGAGGSFTSGASLLYQTNTNIGARIIVPDATTLEGSVFAYAKKRIKRISIEGGARFDTRNIEAFETLSLNVPFNRSWNVVNGSLGLAWDPVEALNIKANISSGYRSGNLAELGSSGLHEGTRRWEIGDPDLRAESNISAEVGLSYEWREQVAISVTAFGNSFSDYIYLTPTGTDTLGLHIYRFVQTDAVLQGGEATLEIHPTALKWLDISLAYSHLQADKGDSTPLPFIPADRLNTDLRLSWRTTTWIRFGATAVSAQDRPAQFETATPAYALLNIAAGKELHWMNDVLEIALVCNNVTDGKYVDHLSRFKAFGLYDIGRNLSLSLKLSF